MRASVSRQKTARYQVNADQAVPRGVVPKTSVNRGSLSESEDVLFAEDGRFDGLGVVEFSVSDVPTRVDQDQGPAYLFFLQHVPLSDNYAHSEIWSDQDSTASDQDSENRIYRTPSKTVKLKF